MNTYHDVLASYRIARMLEDIDVSARLRSIDILTAVELSCTEGLVSADDRAALIKAVAELQIRSRRWIRF